MNKKLICMGIVSMFLLTGFVNVSALETKLSILNNGDGDQLDQENDAKADMSPGIFVGEDFCAAQSFKPTYNILTRVKLYYDASWSGTPTSIELAVRTNLDSNNIAFASAPMENKMCWKWMEFDFEDTAVIPENTYYLLWRTVGGSTCWTYTGEGDPYERGRAWFKWYDEWEDWGSLEDYWFRTYGRNGDDGNHPPDALTLISGPTEGKTGEEITYEFQTNNDIDGDQIKCKIEWRNQFENSYQSIITDLYSTYETVSVTLNFKPGVYWMRATALDEHNAESLNSIEIGPIWINDYQNLAPFKPELDGPTFGYIRENYEYRVTSLDCDKDEIYFKFDWGDGTNSEWLGPYEPQILEGSYETCTATHKWKHPHPNIYVKVKAKDEHGKESEWSDPLIVSMPRNRATQKPFLNFLQNHPNLFPILQRLLNL